MTIEELLAREAVRDTIARFTRASDSGRTEETAEQFHLHGEFVDSRGHHGSGRAAILAMLNSWTGSAPPVKHADTKPVLRHFTSNTQFVAVKPDRIEAITYFCSMTAVGNDHWGRYFDVFEPHGKLWLFSRRAVKIEGYAEGGWYHTNRSWPQS
ncbi:MAG: nuclear transport factor 2 family protein [Sphingomonadaceae bacterium]|nr:nuclear transport factor 2 family protein [Sphingomonadaceae bacterium]